MRKIILSIGRYIGTVLIFTIILSSILLIGVGYGYKEASKYKEEVLNQYDIQNYEYKPSLTTQIFSKNGTLLAEIYSENRRYLFYNKIPENIISALISVEDRRFYDHHGIDFWGIARALVSNIETGNLTGQGASTITQQLTRQLFLSQEKSWERKIKEMIIALELEKKYDKHKILEMYLNEVYFGHQAYGIEAASRVYFGKKAEELSLDEFTLLVGLPQSPSRYDPYYYPEKATKRRLGVLDSMVRDGIITSDKAKEIANKPVVLANKESDDRKVANMVYPYFTSWVIQELENKYGKRIYSEGWKIYTTIDDKAQKLAEDVAKKEAEKFSKWYKADDIAIVTVNPQTGELVAMAGGADFSKNQINMAAKPRQPGSSMKPYIYAVGIEKNKITDSTIMLDEPINYNGYSPKNYDRNNRGYLTIREALRVSNNVVAVKTAKEVGIQNIRYYLEKLGVTSLSDKDQGLGIAIGGLTYGISPYEMASAYGVFANRGVLVTPHYVDRIVDQRGNVVEKTKTETQRVFSTETTDLLTDMLVDVVVRGTGTASQISRQSAGKTGTTDDSRDFWFVGYTPNAATAVWVGNSDFSKTVGSGSSGSSAGQAWSMYMEQYVKNIPKVNFAKDYGLKSYDLYLSPNAPPRLAGNYCTNNSLEENTSEHQREYVVKSMLLQPRYAPSEVVNCEPLTSDDYKDYFNKIFKEKGSLKELIEKGYFSKLVSLGYTKQLVEEGYFDKLAKEGYIEELKSAGYTQKLIEGGYIQPPPTKEEESVPSKEESNEPPITEDTTPSDNNSQNEVNNTD